MFQITKFFIGGILDGLTIVETTNVEFKVGTRCMNPLGGSAYEIIACVKVG